MVDMYRVWNIVYMVTNVIDKKWYHMEIIYDCQPAKHHGIFLSLVPCDEKHEEISYNAHNEDGRYQVVPNLQEPNTNKMNFVVY